MFCRNYWLFIVLGFWLSNPVLAQRFPSDTTIEFTGTIANQPILAELTETENGLIGRYKYLKIGKIIDIEGVIDPKNGNAIELTEGGNNSKKIWRAVYRHDSILGQWQEAGKKDRYPIKLAKKTKEQPRIAFTPITMDTLVYANPNDTTSAKLTYKDRRLRAKGNSKLSQWLNGEINKEIQADKPQFSMAQNMRAEMRASVAGYKENVEESKDSEYGKYQNLDWDFENESDVQYEQKGYLTLWSGGYQFSGGAHGTSWELYDNYDLTHQKKFELSAIMAVDSVAIEQLLEASFREEYDVENDENLKEFGLFEAVIKPNENFFFDDWGITFVYNQYEIGPYVMGIIHLFIPWDKVKSYLKSEFTKRMYLE